MSRPKEFDESEVLERALELFRARGFEHTSFGDLTVHLGVSRQSLYDTYGDKQTLFHTALRRYSAKGLDFLRRQLAGEGPVKDQLAAFFAGMIDGSCSHGSPGCLMVNAMVELCPHDADVRAAAAEHARAFEGLLASAFSAAQRRGELTPDKDPVALARFIYTAMLGLAVSARALGDRESLRQSASLALRLLD